MGTQNSTFCLKSHQQFLQMLDLKSLPLYFSQHKRLPSYLLNRCSIIRREDELRKMYSETFRQMKEIKSFQPQFLAFQNQEIQRCVASLLGLGICDALGASTEFIPYHHNGLGIIKNGFQDVNNAIQCGLLESRHGTIGIWTDDCSMALSMATSLLFNKGKFDPKHIRYMFMLWIFNGLSNGGRKHSIGLGGNIKISIEQFFHKQTDFCEEGNKFNNGNGSLMRLAPIPIAFRNNVEDALYLSGLSSRTTHNGEEAKECCRLLSFILIRLYKRKEDKSPKQVLQQACNEFVPEVQSVFYLSRSMRETEELFKETSKNFGKLFTMFNKSVEDRDWNWKAPDFRYSKTRALDKPGYVGSYCMDALAMALHTVWKTSSFKEVAIINADLGGDCDTVGAIAGQIAGAMYGMDQEMLRLYSEMVDFKESTYELFLHGLKLTQL